ncbi:MAG TPA: hypothetical protein VGJ20_05830 [Xanthobacteraceae bacterium]|jgi:hypothetical protein
MRLKITALAAFILGITMASASAFAQAHNVNDGGLVVVPSAAKSSAGVLVKPAPRYGMNPNDGGQVEAPRGTTPSRGVMVKPVPRYGMNPNDGGQVVAR